MPPFFINIPWQSLLIIAGVACISAIALTIGLIIGASREKPEDKQLPKERSQPSPQSKTPEIMGSTRQPERQSPPIEATKRQTENREEKPVTFAREIPKAELDQVFRTEETDQIDTREDPDPDEDQVNWQDEETELQAHRTAESDDTDFATGVSFGELKQVTRLIQKEELQPDEQLSVTATAVKLAHTDLWEKVMSALPDANQKIAKMLDPSPPKVQAAEDWQNFDIRNFI